MILREPDPIHVADRFSPMRAELLQILSRLDENQWQYPTACAGWTVKDVALHLLGDDIGLLSRRRDNFSHAQIDVATFEQLVAFINLQNDIWIRAARRMSPEVLLTLLQVTGKAVVEWVQSLDPMAVGAPVEWAGSKPAPQWMEIAREYTEYWTHHQHISDALGIMSLKDETYLHPVLDAFMRSLPRAYTRTPASLETLVKITTVGTVEQSWYLLRERQGWRLYEHTNLEPHCVITTEDDIVWRLFTKGISRIEAEPHTQIEGDTALVEPFYNAVSILA